MFYAAGEGLLLLHFILMAQILEPGTFRDSVRKVTAVWIQLPHHYVESIFFLFCCIFFFKAAVAAVTHPTLAWHPARL